jgi:hypothetical protein
MALNSKEIVGDISCRMTDAPRSHPEDEASPKAPFELKKSLDLNDVAQGSRRISFERWLSTKGRTD